MVVLRRSTGSPFETVDILLLYNDATILANFEPEWWSNEEKEEL